MVYAWRNANKKVIVNQVNIVMKIKGFVMTFVELMMTAQLVTYAMRMVNAWRNALNKMNAMKINFVIGKFTFIINDLINQISSFMIAVVLECAWRDVN